MEFYYQQSDIGNQVLARKQQTEAQLEQQRIKTWKLETELKDLKNKTKSQADVISKLT